MPCGGGRELLEVVSVVYMQKYIHLVQKLRRNEYFQSHFLRVSFFVAGSWRNFFPVVLLCQFLVLAGNRFRFYILTYLEYKTVVALC